MSADTGGGAAESRQALYDALGADVTVEETAREMLTVGREYLGVDNGHVERIVDGGHEVTVSVGETVGFFEGDVLDRATTYCRRTVDRDSPLALSDAPAQGFGDDPAYERHGFDCYLGARIRVDDEVYGTVCFVSRAARSEPFEEDERAFVELIARLLGREIEQRRHERTLERRESALAASERRHEALLSAAPDAIVTIDPEAGEIVDANEAAGELVGRPSAAIEGREVATLVPPDLAEEATATLGRLAETGATRDRLPDGTPLEVDHAERGAVPVEASAGTVTVAGEPYLQVIVRDVSERWDREEELRVKDRAMDEATVGITIADATAEDEPLVYANAAFAGLAGRPVSELLGRNCRFLQGQDTDPEAVAEIREAVAAERSVRTELLNYRGDGTPFWNRLSITPVTDRTGETTHFVGIQRDVTDRKRRERLIELLNRVLRHNLRNDMTAITGRAEWLAERTTGREREVAESIARQGWELVDTSEKARTLERAVRRRPDPVGADVVPIVERVVGRLRESHPAATVRLSVPGSAVATVGDTLERALLEVGENAVEHGSDTPTVEFRVTDGDEGVTVTVSDAGPGMPASERRVLHGEDETPLEHGTGIGLWLAGWLVRDTGGTVDATVDDGTTVRVVLRPAPDGTD